MNDQRDAVKNARDQHRHLQARRRKDAERARRARRQQAYREGTRRAQLAVLSGERGNEAMQRNVTRMVETEMEGSDA